MMKCRDETMKMKRVRHSNAGPLLFRVSNANGVVSRLGNEEGDIEDSADYAVYFKPPIEMERAKTVHVGVTYQGNDRIADRILFGQWVLPSDGNGGTPLILQAGVLEYLIFPTHQLRIENGTVCTLYVRIVNVTTTIDPRFNLFLRGDVDVELPKIKSLTWFPPDVDPSHWGLKIDSRLIPQRCPLWFKLRGELTGSKAYKLLGFFMNDTSQSTASRMNMRRGTHSEPEAIIMYSLAYPNAVLQEVGWCPASDPYPETWGASPDMLIDDNGVLEIKTSTLKTSMEDYFYPQCYMEMLATQRYYCDVIRFRPLRFADGRIEDAGHVYRIIRDEALLDTLCKLWMRALSVKNVQSEPDYVQIRDLFSKMASDASWSQGQRIEATPEYCSALRDYQRNLKALAKPILAPSDGIAVDLEAELHERAMETVRAIEAKRPKSEIIGLLTEQINTLVGL